MSIIIVDDNKDICNLLSEYLSSEGHRVRCCHNPIIVFEMITQQRPKIIITDMLMTGIDGREIVNKLKQDKSTQNIKTILMSAHPDSEEISKSINTDGFIAKPFDLEDLSAKISSLLQ